MDALSKSCLDDLEAWRAAAEMKIKVKNLSFSNLAERFKKGKPFNENLRPQDVLKTDPSGVGCQCGVQVKPRKEIIVLVFLPPQGSTNLG